MSLENKKIFLTIKVLTSGLMYLYLNLKFIVSSFGLVNNFLTLFLTVPPAMSNSLFLFTLPVIFSNKPSSAYNSQTNLAYYLAGLIEGDGSFSFPKIIKDSNGKKRVAGIEIIGNIKDKPAYDFLQHVVMYTLQRIQSMLDG